MRHVSRPPAASFFSVASASLSALLLALVGCARAPAAPTPGPSATAPSAEQQPPLTFDAPLPAQPVRGADDLGRLCDQLRDEGSARFAGNEVEQERARVAQHALRETAVGRSYVTEIPSGGFSLSFDLADQRVTVDPKGLALAPGAELYTADPERPLVFAVTADSAEKLARAQDAGQLTLRLLFRAAPSPMRAELCMRLGGGIAKLAVTPLGATLMGAAGETLARVETDEYREALAAVVPVRNPQVRVETPSSGDRRQLPPEVIAAARALGPKLLPCYEKALTAQPRLRGRLIVGARLATDGRLEAARMEVSAVADEALVACVVERLGKARLAAGTTAQVSMPITFGAADELR